MPKSKSVHFFATKRDLELLLAAVESQRSLKYTQAGMFDVPGKNEFASGSQIPGLGLARSGDSNGEPFWLVTDAHAHVTVETVPQRRGGTRYGIDPGLNPESVVIWPGGEFAGRAKWPGGEFEGRAVIAGQIGTAMMNPISMELMNLFTREVRRHFNRIKSFFVGPEAEQLLDAGYRLTTSVKSPKEIDLSRD